MLFLKLPMPFLCNECFRKPDFTEILRRVYDAVEELDFGNPSAVDAINGWWLKNTDKITKSLTNSAPMTGWCC